MSKLQNSVIHDKQHAEASHARWIQQLNRVQYAPGYKDEWFGEQCGACRYFVPLTGALIEDWGACTNPVSKFDRRVMFEHDGCESFEEANDAWDSIVPNVDKKLDEQD